MARPIQQKPITFECGRYIGSDKLNQAIASKNPLPGTELGKRLVAVSTDVERHKDPDATNIARPALTRLADFIEGKARGSIELFSAPNWAWDLPGVRALRFGIRLNVLKVTSDLQTIRNDTGPAAAYGTNLSKANTHNHDLYLLEQQSAADPTGTRMMAVLDGHADTSRVVLEAANTFSWTERHLADLALRDYATHEELNTFLGSNKANRWTAPDGPSLLAALQDFGQNGQLSPDPNTDILYFQRRGASPL